MLCRPLPRVAPATRATAAGFRYHMPQSDLYLPLRNRYTAMTCFFCKLDPSRILDSNEHGIMLRDDFPVSPGHTLVVPRRHVGSFFELDAGERQGLLALLDAARRAVDAEFRPDAYNIGLNDGPAAGQSIPHVHLHLIPRFHGDCADPRGGVRWILPDKAKYWAD